GWGIRPTAKADGPACFVGAIVFHHIEAWSISVVAANYFQIIIAVEVGKNGRLVGVANVWVKNRKSGENLPLIVENIHSRRGGCYYHVRTSIVIHIGNGGGKGWGSCYFHRPIGIYWGAVHFYGVYKTLVAGYAFAGYNVHNPIII